MGSTNFPGASCHQRKLKMELLILPSYVHSTAYVGYLLLEKPQPYDCERTTIILSKAVKNVLVTLAFSYVQRPH